MKWYLRKQNKNYAKNLSNFKTIIKDTNHEVTKAEDQRYNCMSYAFGVFNRWLGLRNFIAAANKDILRLEDIFGRCCNEILENYNCRLISSPYETIESCERIIAFRIGFDDFHFARLGSDGIWTHKPGGTAIKEMSEEELFDIQWCKYRAYPYESSIAFFAVQI